MWLIVQDRGRLSVEGHFVIAAEVQNTSFHINAEVCWLERREWRNEVD